MYELDLSQKKCLVNISVLLSISDDKLDFKKNNGTKLHYDHYLDSEKLVALREFAEDLSLGSYLDTSIRTASTFISYVNSSVSKTFHKYKSVRHIQELTAKLIMDNGLNIQTMSRETIEKWMSYVPVVKQEILNDVITKITIDLKALPNQGKKTFLFELSKFISKNDYLEIKEMRNFLENLYRNLNVDIEYIDEFDDYSRDFNKIIKEYNVVKNKLTRVEETINELINE